VAACGGKADRIALCVIVVNEAEIKLGLGPQSQFLERYVIGIVVRPFGTGR
jgi:hypothetical protein